MRYKKTLHFQDIKKAPPQHIQHINKMFTIIAQTTTTSAATTSSRIIEQRKRRASSLIVRAEPAKPKLKKAVSFVFFRGGIGGKLL